MRRVEGEREQKCINFINALFCCAGDKYEPRAAAFILLFGQSGLHKVCFVCTCCTEINRCDTTVLEKRAFTMRNREIGERK